MTKAKIQTIGERIAIAREKRGLTQQDLGRLVGKSKQLLSAVETGRSVLMTPTLAKISKVMSVDPKWLLFGGDDPQFSALPQGQEVPWLSPQQVVNLARGKHEPGTHAKAVFSPEPASESAFAYSLADNGMKPSLLAGDLLLIDPDRKVVPGAIVMSVIFRDGTTKLAEPAILVREVSLGSLSIDQPPYSLVPLREGYPRVDVRHRRDSTILGVVSAVWRSFGAGLQGR